MVENGYSPAPIRLHIQVKETGLGQSMPHPSTPTRWLAPILVALAVGCTPGVRLRSTVPDAIFAKRRDNVLTSSGASSRAMQLLRRYDLDRRFRADPLLVLELLDRQARHRPDADTVFALAELSYLTGRKFQRTSRQAAITLYLRTVGYAYFYLFDPEIGGCGNRYDPRFRLACDLYNRSLAECIRLAQKEDLLSRDSLRVDSAGGSIDLPIVRHGFLWKAEDFGHFRFASDYEVEGLTNHHQNYGLGVPLIAVRDPKATGDRESPYYPEEQSFPVTAFLRVHGGIRGGGGTNLRASLELYDPLQVQSIEVAGEPVPLESDLTTPLGYYLSRAKLEKWELTGFLRPEKLRNRTGLYMLQPYEPGKIPVVLVHGLWSSPMAWMQMFNDLRGDPLIRSRYQFWFFTYPTGTPLAYSANILRSELDEVRTTLDPEGRDTAFDEMVLVGHSMGGLISKMMAQHSQDNLWSLVSTRPVEMLDASGEERQRIRQVFFFEPKPYVRRIIFIATPHQGSSLSGRLIGRFGSALISMPRAMMEARDRLLARNPEAFTPFFQAGAMTSVDNLAPDSPVLQALASLPIDQRVRYHSIVGDISGAERAKWTDGIVDYASARIDGATSEYIVPASHSVCQSHPLTVLEVRRILFRHLEDLETERPIQQADLEAVPAELP